VCRLPKELFFISEMCSNAVQQDLAALQHIS
jgi:hypothetical protein